ncbi:hypothetical protein REG_0733 [Candidatus Regiella insecticola LSR1]|uniref:Uncharacterized protein n=1 Tax=Candidatus Regiella insecticola LSR1 TaxID=663321 RepID=E0WS17_9ENTR|nr:hypothetical protein [Candidatus Regiella insecticola]EFL92151.1 hypothetical protein REG_0733 [Candidatus Regiella insecticola LSR1]
MNFELRQGGKGVRPMSVDRLRDSASARSQRRRNLKSEGYRFVLDRYAVNLQNPKEKTNATHQATYL